MSDYGYSQVTDESELRELREEVRNLTRRVDRLVDRVRELEAKDRTAPPSPAREAQLPIASSSYSQVVTVPLTVGLSGSVQQLSPGEQSREEVENICIGIGRFLQRALTGNYRGNSGRHRLLGGSTVYLVVRDASGLVSTEPCRVYRDFSEVKRICCVKGQWCNSVFVGLPGIPEVRLVCQAAGFSSPE